MLSRSLSVVRTGSVSWSISCILMVGLSIKFGVKWLKTLTTCTITRDYSGKEYAMKQGTAGRNVSAPKREPNPHSVDVCAVEDLGDSVSFQKPDLYDGRGYKAPMNASETSHKSGSQGRH